MIEKQMGDMKNAHGDEQCMVGDLMAAKAKIKKVNLGELFIITIRNYSSEHISDLKL